MPFRNIFISKPSYLSIDRGQLVIRQGVNNYTANLEDLSTLVIENRESTITAYTISQLAENQIATYVCDARHIPNGVLLPFCCHSRHLKALSSQISMSCNLKQQLWQTIIKNKIDNQAFVLHAYKKENIEMLQHYVNQVEIGDCTNIEARAAMCYFDSLFDKNTFGVAFSRKDDCFVNDALNYGYAIVRGMIACTLVAFGYEPSLGLFHSSELNAFNLADDIIEPFRPFVDLYIFKLLKKYTQLDSDCKQKIFSLVEYEIKIDNEKFNLSTAIERYIVGFNQSVEQSCDKLSRVRLGVLRLHSIV